MNVLLKKLLVYNLTLLLIVVVVLIVVIVVVVAVIIIINSSSSGPPLWSSGQSFWLHIQRSRVRSPALPDFLSSSGSGTGSTQPREVN